MLNPGEQWQTYRHHGQPLSLEYRLRFRCDSNYYGPVCNKFCRARDDFFGHFNCDPSGSKVCMDGWTGPECKEGKKENLKSPVELSWFRGDPFQGLPLRVFLFSVMLASEVISQALTLITTTQQ